MSLNEADVMLSTHYHPSGDHSTDEHHEVQEAIVRSRCLTSVGLHLDVTCK